MFIASASFGARSVIVMPDPPILNFLNFPNPNTCTILSLGMGTPIAVLILNNPSNVTQNVTAHFNFTRVSGCGLNTSSLVAGTSGVGAGFANASCTAGPNISGGWFGGSAITCVTPTVSIPPSSSVAINVAANGGCAAMGVMFLGSTLQLEVAEGAGYLVGSLTLQCPALTIQTPFVTRINQGKPF